MTLAKVWFPHENENKHYYSPGAMVRKIQTFYSYNPLEPKDQITNPKLTGN